MSLTIENDDPKIGPEEEEMLSFIIQQGKIRWSALVREFEEKRKWCHSKFVKHWKNVKPHLARVPNKKTGRDDYTIRGQSQGVGDKALLRTQIDSGKLSGVEISPERFEKVAEQLKQMYADLNVNLIDDKAIKLENQFNAEISAKKEEISEKAQASLRFLAFMTTIAQTSESEKRLKKGLVETFGRVKIQIVTSPGETAPILTDDDIIQLSGIIFPKIMDENKGKPREKPFQLIISYPNFNSN